MAANNRGVTVCENNCVTCENDCVPCENDSVTCDNGCVTWLVECGLVGKVGGAWGGGNVWCDMNWWVCLVGCVFGMAGVWMVGGILVGGIG